MVVFALNKSVVFLKKIEYRVAWGPAAFGTLDGLDKANNPVSLASPSLSYFFKQDNA